MSAIIKYKGKEIYVVEQSEKIILDTKDRFLDDYIVVENKTSEWDGSLLEKFTFNTNRGSILIFEFDENMTWDDFVYSELNINNTLKNNGSNIYST